MPNEVPTPHLTTITFQSPTKNISENRRFKGFILFISKFCYYELASLIYDNDEKDFNIYAKFDIPQEEISRFKSDVNEYSRDFQIHKNITVD